jgi:rhodanese-related sulfurtransferase
MQQYSTVDGNEISRRISRDEIDNRDPAMGTALVNVLGHEAFEQKHIPNSINIPVDELDQFEQRFRKDKDIIVYCASAECDASVKAAEALSARGFRNVSDYVGGIAEWAKQKQPLAGRSSTPSGIPS